MMVVDYNDGDNNNNDRRCYLANHCHPILLVLWHLGIGIAIAIGSNNCHDDGNNEEIATIELMPGNVERQQRRPPKPVR